MWTEQPRGRDSGGVWRRLTRCRRWLPLVSALGLAVGCVSGPKVIVETPTCPEPPDALFVSEALPEGWERWYLDELEPFCEGLYRAAVEAEDSE